MTGDSSPILDRLAQNREADAPTHGGRLLSYVYDSGREELDRLAAEAMRLTLPVNGLDPTMFPSVPTMERDLVNLALRLLHGKRWRGRNRVFGSITSGGTESCMLAVKTARSLWQEQHPNSPTRPVLLAPATVHAAFHKAASYFGLTLELVPVAEDGSVSSRDIIARLRPEVALVVVSAPSYPTAQLDPVAEVSRAALSHGISCHVDACIGGFALPLWDTPLPVWDFRLRGVTSISADLHKFGYAPKGASVLLQRGRVRHRHQFFATTSWPGYPVVNPTLLGSRSATSLAAAWAIAMHLGVEGYRTLMGEAAQATHQLTRHVHTIRGLRVLGTPTGPLFALAADPRVPREDQVDPHHLADALKRMGFLAQHQPGLRQERGVPMPHSVHMTITPVTLARVDELCAALSKAADEMRGVPRANPKLERFALRALGLMRPNATLSPAGAGRLLRLMGVGGSSSSLPAAMAPLMRLLEELPPAVAKTLLIEVLAQ